MGQATVVRLQTAAVGRLLVAGQPWLSDYWLATLGHSPAATWVPFFV
jgi:hypothetical protein